MDSVASRRLVTNKMCPFAQKAWIALEKTSNEVPYQLEQISLYGPYGKPNWFWELNPQGTVPVLVYRGSDDKENVVTDSDLILTDMEQGKVPGCQSLVLSSLDSTTVERVSEWRKIMNQKVLPLGKKAVFSGSLSPQLQTVLSELDADVVGPFLTGNVFTTADCHAFPFLWRMQQEFDLSDYPNLVQWIHYCADQEPAVRKTVQSAWWWWW